MEVSCGARGAAEMENEAMKQVLRTMIVGALASMTILVAQVGCNATVPDSDSLQPKKESPKDTPKKGGGTTGQAAQTSGQKGGGTATSKTSSAQDKGAEVEGLVCDASLESIGWCEDEATIMFCSSGVWWLLSCPEIEPDAFCGYDDDLNIVDCYVIEECLELDEACIEDGDCCSGICDDDGFCDDGLVECLDIDEACVEDADCCSGICDDAGYCDDGLTECLDVGVACWEDSDCCSGVCGDDGTCD